MGGEDCMDVHTTQKLLYNFISRNTDVIASVTTLFYNGDDD